MNIYKQKSLAVTKGVNRIKEYLELLNFAAEDYHAAKNPASRAEKYKALDQAYREYLTCNQQVMVTFRELHVLHNQEQGANNE